MPVIGVNFGRVGFLSSMGRHDLEHGLGRVFAGEYDVVELPTLELEHPDGRTVAVNDVVVSSASLGRMIELELAVGGEELGRQPCDGIICATPSGSTAYNLSNGGPVLMWGLEAIALTYVAAHSLRARPIVIPPAPTSSSGTGRPTSKRACWSTGIGSRRSQRRTALSSGSAPSDRCSRRCPRRRSSAATARALLRRQSTNTLKGSR